MNRAMVGLVCALLVAPCAWAQTAAGGPEDGARAMAERLRAADWDGMAELMHPHALKQLRSWMQPFLEMEDAAPLRQQLLGVSSPKEFAGLTDVAWFGRFLRGALSRDPDLLPALRTAQVEVLGHIMAGDTAHVVGRLTLTASGIRISKMEVTSWVRFDGAWRGLLSGDISQLAEVLKEAARQRVGSN